MDPMHLEMNPFLNKASPPDVYVAHGGGPYKNTRTALARLDLSVARGKRVLLKPNAGRKAAGGEGITTEPQVVAAAIDAFREAGAQVAIGESPITGVRALDAFEATGIAAVARERACPLIDLDARQPVACAIPEGRVLKGVKLCADLMDFDLVVSLPVMKIHMHTGVTLSIKNMKGCLWRRSKVELHMLPEVAGQDDKPLNIAIADLAGVIRPHLSIIDGSVGMEGMGPSAGSPKPLGVVIAGADAFAADAVACRLMGIDPGEIAYLRIGAERGYGVIDLARISVVPERWRSWESAFAPAPASLSIEFPGIDVQDNNSCSACQSTLLLFLKKYGSAVLDYCPQGSRITIAIGKGHTRVATGTVCVGNCTAKHRAAGLFAAGCPPVGSEILKAITGETSMAASKVSNDVKE